MLEFLNQTSPKTVKADVCIVEYPDYLFFFKSLAFHGSLLGRETLTQQVDQL